MSLFKKKYPILFFILLLPSFWALFIPGFYGASDDLHIAWLFEFNKSLLSGQLPPRFVPDLSFGFGYPLFNFVFPLPFYVGELLHLFGLSFVDSVKGVFLISIILSAIGMYFLLKEYTTKTLSFLGALLYVYTPYRSTDIYVRGAIGEAASFVFFPLIILSGHKVVKEKSLRWIGVGAISLSGLILTHNIAAYMFFPFAVLFFFLLIIFDPKKMQSALKIFTMLLLSILISLYFWLPAILDSSLVKYDTVFNFIDHFPTIKQLFLPYWGYGASVAGPYDGMSFYLGNASIIVLLLSLFLLKFWKKYSSDQRILIAWSYICFIFAFIFMNFRSTYFWQNIPLLPYFQFPWRFLTLTTFCLPLLIITFEKIKFKYINLILILIILIPTATFFRPHDFLGREDNYFLDKYIPVPSASEEYLKTQEEYLRLPKDTEIRPDSNYPIFYPQDNIKSVVKINEFKYLAEVQSDTGTEINFSKYYFPGWVGKIDGEAIDLYAGKPFGQVTLQVPAGLHQLEIKFEETGLKKVLDAISLVSFLVSLILVLNLWRILKKVPGSSS